MSDPIKLAIIGGIVSVLSTLVTAWFAYRTKVLTGQVKQMHAVMKQQLQKGLPPNTELCNPND